MTRFFELFDVRPRLSLASEPDRCEIDAVLSAEACEGLAVGASGADRSNGIGIQAGGALPTFLDHIARVIGGSAHEQMRRIEAAANVAVMEDAERRAEIEAEPNMSGDTMDGSVLGSAALLPYCRLPVAIREEGELPQPAAALIDEAIGEEPNFEFIPRVGRLLIQSLEFSR